MKFSKLIKPALVLTGCLAFASAKAQVNPMGAQYYLNQYLANPAMAGLEEGLNLTAGFRKQIASIPGSPQDQAVTAEYRMNRVGLGINFNNDKAGLLRQNRTVATFAYHIPVNTRDAQLHLGVSAGVYTQRLSDQDIIGNPNDPAVGDLNRRDAYFDGDAGAAFTTEGLTLQAALPNLKNLFNQDFRNVANLATFNTSAAYKFMLADEGITLEPRVGYRGVKSMDNFWDAGTRVGFLNDAISAFAMYHSTNSVTFGFGAKTLRNTLSFQGVYTTETSALRNNSNGNFEINLRYRIF